MLHQPGQSGDASDDRTLAGCNHWIEKVELWVDVVDGANVDLTDNARPLEPPAAPRRLARGPCLPDWPRN